MSFTCFSSPSRSWCVLQYVAGQQNVRLKTWWCPHEEVNMHKTASMHCLFIFSLLAACAKDEYLERKPPYAWAGQCAPCHTCRLTAFLLPMPHSGPAGNASSFLLANMLVNKITSDAHSFFIKILDTVRERLMGESMPCPAPGRRL